MTNKLKIKKGDTIIVTCGKDKGKQGKVTKVFPVASKVKVSGVAVAKHHMKPSMSSPGQRLDKEMAIDISNVAYLDPKSGSATKIGYKFLEDGSKVRYMKSSGDIIDN